MIANTGKALLALTLTGSGRKIEMIGAREAYRRALSGENDQTVKKFPF